MTTKRLHGREDHAPEAGRADLNPMFARPGEEREIPLDPAGNSVRAQAVVASIARALQCNLYALYAGVVR